MNDDFPEYSPSEYRSLLRRQSMRLATAVGSELMDCWLQRPPTVEWKEHCRLADELLPAIWGRRANYRREFWDDVLYESGEPFPIKQALKNFEWYAGEPISKPLARYGNWFVTEWGVECLYRPYYFANDRVHQYDWFAHVSQKTWVVPEHFGCALFDARRRVRTSREREISKRQRFSILKRDGYKCQLCGASANDGVILHVDHKIPLAKGGDSSKGNLWTLCADCNMGKGVELIQNTAKDAE